MQPVDLAYIAVVSRDVDATRTFLGDHLHLPSFVVGIRDDGQRDAFRVGETAIVLFAEGDQFLSGSRPGVDHIALAADDPEAIASSSELAGAATAAGGGLDGLKQVAFQREATCGVSVRLTPNLSLPDTQSDLVTRIDHIGIASADNAAAEAVFLGSLGAVYESRQTDMEVATAIESFTSDKYGAVYHSRSPTPVGGLRVSFLTVGDCELEFLQDYDPAQGFDIRHGSAGTTKQDQSAIGRFVATRGAGLHHIAFKVDDIDAMLSRLGALGHRMIDIVGRPGSRRARIGFVHPASTGGILFHFVERQELAP